MCQTCTTLNAKLDTSEGTVAERIQWMNTVKRCPPAPSVPFTTPSPEVLEAMDYIDSLTALKPSHIHFQQ